MKFSTANFTLLAEPLPWWLSSKESTLDAEDAGDTGSIPGLGRSPGRGHGNPLQYSCLENTMDRGAWWVQSDTTEKLSTFLLICFLF